MLIVTIVQSLGKKGRSCRTAEKMCIQDLSGYENFNTLVYLVLLGSHQDVHSQTDLKNWQNLISGQIYVWQIEDQHNVLLQGHFVAGIVNQRHYWFNWPRKDKKLKIFKSEYVWKKAHYYMNWQRNQNKFLTRSILKDDEASLDLENCLWGLTQRKFVFSHTYLQINTLLPVVLPFIA